LAVVVVLNSFFTITHENRKSFLKSENGGTIFEKINDENIHKKTYFVRGEKNIF